MLFSKEIEPKCEYCRRSLPFANGETYGCKLHGVMGADDKCRRFVYDPLKRVPEPPVIYTPREFDKDEFEL